MRARFFILRDSGTLEEERFKHVDGQQGHDLGLHPHPPTRKVVTLLFWMVVLHKKIHKSATVPVHQTNPANRWNSIYLKLIVYLLYLADKETGLLHTPYVRRICSYFPIYSVG